MSSTQKRAILQVRIREEDKQHAEHLYDAMATNVLHPLEAGVKSLSNVRV